MRILEMLRTIKSVIDLPDFDDKEAVRKWLLKICGIGTLITERTPTPADDAALAFLERAIASDKLFGPAYDLLTALIGAEPGCEPACMAPPELTLAASEAGIGILEVIAIVEAIASLIKFIRDRRK